MGGSLNAYGPGADDASEPLADAYHSYSGFMDFKVILLHATIAFLTAFSAKDISKKMIVEEGIATEEAIEGTEEDIVISNYRARINAAIAVLQSWLRSSRDGRKFSSSTSKMQFDPQPSGGPHSWIAALLAQTPLVFEKFDGIPTPNSLIELGLRGVHDFIKFPDGNGTIEYEQAKEFGRLMQKGKKFCVWDEKSWPPPEHGEERFIDEVIAVFEAVPPGGKVVN
ncbi:hypothetical protein B0H10DRAFT_2229707 [Mycena sp. CBHHK59/15]|nr:hypothetical protein B0H10DRAFT_2229707 [Mycena sp. CBHHK59/15]